MIHQRQDRLPPAAAVIEGDRQKKTLRTGPVQVEIMNLEWENDNAALRRELKPHVVQPQEGGRADIALDLVTLMTPFFRDRNFLKRREKDNDVIGFDPAGIFQPAGEITGGRSIEVHSAFLQFLQQRFFSHSRHPRQFVSGYRPLI